MELAEWGYCAAVQCKLIQSRSSQLPAAADASAAAACAAEQKADKTQCTSVAVLALGVRQQLGDTRKTYGPVACKYCR